MYLKNLLCTSKTVRGRNKMFETVSAGNPSKPKHEVLRFVEFGMHGHLCVNGGRGVAERISNSDSPDIFPSNTKKKKKNKSSQHGTSDWKLARSVVLFEDKKSCHGVSATSCIPWSPVFDSAEYWLWANLPTPTSSSDVNPCLAHIPESNPVTKRSKVALLIM